MAKTLMDAIGTAIFNRTVEAISRPNVPVDNANAATVAREVTAAVKPIVTNATNQEPLWQSRVIAGQVAVYLGAALGLIKLYADGNFDPTLITADVGILLGGALTIYGRIRGASLKPLGQ